MGQFVEWVNLTPNGVVYFILGLGVALENIVPAIPADTFVAVGGLLSTRGDLDGLWVFGASWSLSTLSALIVYRIAYRHGRSFFEGGGGQYLLKSHQLERMGHFYRRWGTPGIFFTRFLPGVRSAVPVFAGVTQQPWLPVAAPIILSSGLWYGGLVGLGIWVGNNLTFLEALLSRLNLVLGVIAAVIVVVAIRWWWRTRRQPHE